MAYDHDAVLITGAGASCPFGTPLMGAWCESLVRKLASAGPGYREATRLSTDLSPEEFERVLGEFLHQVQAWEEIRPLVPFTMGLQPGQVNSAALNSDGVLPGWHNTTKFHLDKIVDLIRASLYELFAGSNIKLQDAAKAYSNLLTLLGITPASRLVYVLQRAPARRHPPGRRRAAVDTGAALARQGRLVPTADRRGLCQLRQ